MSKPIVHAENSARLYGGTADDYIDIHNLLDSSKGAIPDDRHRTLTHNSWFLSNILELIFGVSRVNGAGKRYSVRSIGEQHVLEDYGMRFIPTAQDFLENMDYQDWMNNGKKGSPSSFRKLDKRESASVGKAKRVWSFD
jgi:hypothetical protein